MQVEVLCTILLSCAWDLVATASSQEALLGHEVETIC